MRWMFALLLLLPVAPANAFDGAGLRAMCLGSEDQVTLCSGYTTGIGQTLSLSNSIAGDHMPTKFCAPEGFQPQETGALMLEYLDRHPDKVSWDASVIGLAALTEAFPCPVSSANAPLDIGMGE